MFGLFLAAIYAGYLCLTNHHNPEVFLSVTGFLFYWYAFWAVIGGVFTLGASLLMPLLGGAVAGGIAADKGAGRSALAAAALGGMGGGALSLFIIALFFFKVSLTVGGTYLLSTSITSGTSAIVVWDNTRLLIGSILLFLGIVTSGSSRSN